MQNTKYRIPGLGYAVTSWQMRDQTRFERPLLSPEPTNKTEVHIRNEINNDANFRENSVYLRRIPTRRSGC